MKVRVKVRPSGLLNGVEWPAKGEVVDLPAAVAEEMAKAGTVEVVKETRPASTKDVETRKADEPKKAAAPKKQRS